MGNTCKSWCSCCCKGKTEDPSKVEPEVKPRPVQPPPKEPEQAPPKEPEQAPPKAPEPVAEPVPEPKKKRDLKAMGKELGVNKYMLMAMEKEFNEADDNKDGLANRDEMKVLMTKLCSSDDPEYVDAQVEEAFEELDKDGSGKIKFSEFCNMWYAGED